MALISADEFMRRKAEQFERERGKPRRFKDVGGRVTVWFRERWTFMPQSKHDRKVFVIERFRFSHREDGRTVRGAAPGDLQIRIGYWIGGKQTGFKHRWMWGQSAPLIPAADLVPLIAKAKAEGTIP